VLCLPVRWLLHFDVAKATDGVLLRRRETTLRNDPNGLPRRRRDFRCVACWVAELRLSLPDAADLKEKTDLGATAAAMARVLWLLERVPLHQGVQLSADGLPSGAVLFDEFAGLA
jgi:hypothetical protein